MESEDQYQVSVKTRDGKTFSAEGSLMQCANYADNLIRIEGSCEINVIRTERKGAAS